MKIKRHKTRMIKIGSLRIGGGYPIAIQSMAKVKTSQTAEAVSQIKELEACGCEIVRLAIKDALDAKALKIIKAKVKIPIVADIHFDWRLALAAIESGADKIRLNPGNIYKTEQIREVASAAKSAGIPIRVGVNSGSLKGKRVGHKPQAAVMVSSVLNYIRILERFKFHDIVISLKASTVLDTIEAYQNMANLCDYPLHLGVTATGLPKQGMIKSSIACGALLSQGIGDTLRISLTDEPKEEVAAAKAILQALSLRNFGPQIISCPTCGRCEVDLVRIVRDLESKLQALSPKLQATKPLKVALMGCVVNGPGEAKEADLGVAFGKGQGLLFQAGRPIKKVSLNNCVEVLLNKMGAGNV